VSVPQLRPLGIGEILDVSLKIAWRNAGTLLRIVLFVVAPAQALSVLIQVSATPNYDPGQGIFGPSSDPATTESDTWTIFAGIAVAALIGFLAGQLATGACFKAVAQAYLGEQTTWRESLGFALRRFRSILWIVILGGFLTLLGFLLVIVPGIYLAVAFAVALPVLMTEGLRGRKALGRSRRLVKGRWWRTAILLLVAGLLVSIVGGAISAAVSALTFSSPDEPVVVFLVGALAGTVAALVTTPFSAAYHTVLYFDLRVRQEAFDLQLLAEHLGVEPPPGWTPAPEPEAGPAADGDEPPYWPPPPGWRPRSGGS
jgi:MFS family permease